MTIPFFPRRPNPWPALLLAGIVLWALWLSYRALQPRQVFREARTIHITLQGLEGSQVSFLAKQLRPSFPKPR